MADEPAKEKKRDASRMPRRFKARIARNQNGELVVQFEIEASLEWAPKSIVIRTRDGVVVGGLIDATRTTAACIAGEGLTLTLSLTVPGDLVSRWKSPSPGRTKPLVLDLA